MTEGQESKGVQSLFTDKWALAWMEEHLTELRQSASGQRLLYQSLVISFVVGLAAHVGGYALLSSAPSGLLGLLADLLHALGWSLWTGVVVAVFVQVIPEAKARQIKRALEEYEKFRRDRAQAAGNPE
jgi:putative copper export protein